MNTTKKLLAILLTFVMICGTVATLGNYTGNYEDQISLNVNAIVYNYFTVKADNRAEVGFTGTAGERLVIPERFKGSNGAYYETHGIDSGAFRDCPNLTSIVIPDSVTWIGSNILQNCDSLVSVRLSANTNAIGEFSFYSCGNLSNINIPNSIGWIGNSAFAETAITSIHIPSSCGFIGISAFAGCRSLKTITIEKGVSQIDAYAFFNCIALTDVYFTGTEEQWNEISIGANNECLTKATIHFGA